MPTIEVNDGENKISLSYQVMGEGTPMVLIHGYLCSSEFWTELNGFSDLGYQLIIPDLRGHGNSSVAKDVKIETLADDINLLLEHLQITKAIVIGQSMGGLVTQAFYHAHPEKVIALGLWNTGSKMPLGYGIGSLGYLSRLTIFGLLVTLSYPIGALFRMTLGVGWGVCFYKAWKSEAYKRLVPIVKKTPKPAVIKSAMSLLKFDATDKLKDISVPVMLLHGKKDRNLAIIQMARRLDDNIPNSTLYTVEKAGHFPANETPEEVFGYLEEFLKTIK